MDQGGAPITYILIELFRLENLGGLIIIGGIYAIAVAMTWSRAKQYEKQVQQEKEALTEANA
ncbi:hypothetical protein JCM19240_274 [Vibrio maritimus]|uniref:Uncharacterized protein n=1 Tax=Vibrio maritimus TaxID=990268 RepID=A0A090TWZ2_9VIBR|nr:hypothetical protein JCM19240_274 [Vibrio maritimus]